MKTAKKVWIVISVCLIVLGAVIGTVSFAEMGFNFENLATDKMIFNEHKISQGFNDIKINVNTSDIEFVPSQNDECMVVAIETNKIKHNVSVENGTLYISVEDNRKWYDHIGISFGNVSITVHLPLEYYYSLNVKTDTGEVDVPQFTFNKVEIQTDTGDIGFSSNVLSELDISTDTGNIGLGYIEASDITLESDTGDITFNSTECKNVSVENDTGDVLFNRMVATGKISVTTSTGDVIFDYSDANEILINTSTGDVGGRLLSEKVFICDSSTGKIDVPDSETGGRCEITTDTGDIEIYTNKSK